jgi:hypothetical protein
MTLADEARGLGSAKAKEVAALSWAELDAYGEREEEVTSPSGHHLRVKTIVFWDMEEWASGMYIITKVYPDRGWRRWWPWKAVEGRGGPDDPVPARPRPDRPAAPE